MKQHSSDKPVATKMATVRYCIFEDLSPREQVFLLNARNTASLSKDSETKHGLLLVVDNNVVATGYNGFPAGADDENLPNTRPAKYPYIVHAEINAICNAARRGVSIDGATAYCTGECCLECFKALLQCGVRNFVVGNRGHTRKDDHEKYLRYFSNWYECSITHVIDFPEMNSVAERQLDLDQKYKLGGEPLRVTHIPPYVSKIDASRYPPAKAGDKVYDSKTGDLVGEILASPSVSWATPVDPMITVTTPTIFPTKKAIALGGQISNVLHRLDIGSQFTISGNGGTPIRMFKIKAGFLNESGHITPELKWMINFDNNTIVEYDLDDYKLT